MSNLNIQERRIGDVTILDMDGNIRIGGSTVARKRRSSIWLRKVEIRSS